MKYLTLQEYILEIEMWVPDEASMDWVNQLLTTSILSSVHEGDCTSYPGACLLCCIKRNLNEYSEYRFLEQATCRYCEKEIEGPYEIKPIYCNSCREENKDL